MSVIAFGSETYEKLYFNLLFRKRSLNLMTNLFCLRDVHPLQLENFVNELYMINMDAYNTRYQESSEIEPLEVKNEGSKWTDIELYIMMRSINYNCDESHIKIPKLFEDILLEVADTIIKAIPAYQTIRRSSIY